MHPIWIAAGVALAGLGASTASAQWRANDWSPGSHYERAIDQTQRQCNQSLRWADSRREYNQIARRCDVRLQELRQEYRRTLRSSQRGAWDYDDRWRGRDRDDDDDDD